VRRQRETRNSKYSRVIPALHSTSRLALAYELIGCRDDGDRCLQAARGEFGEEERKVRQAGRRATHPNTGV
jgi:hypothetical protein